MRSARTKDSHYRDHHHLAESDICLSQAYAGFYSCGVNVVEGRAREPGDFAPQWGRGTKPR